MVRGGRRAGKAGVAYTNRSDLTPAAAPGQPYGAAGAQIAAQRAIPMGAPPVPPPAAPVPQQTAPAVLPGQVPALDRPTERPDEPITAGAPFGPGAGPQGLAADTTKDQLLALYRRFPNEDLRRLIETVDTGGF